MLVALRIGLFDAALLFLGDVRAPAEPTEIIDGTVVSECAWPSVVALEDEQTGERCTGTYIGGRIVITAAHCMSSGWSVEVFENCEQAGCPSMGMFDNVLSLSCDAGGETCSSMDPLHSSAVRVALFGEHYRRPPDGHIRRGIEIAYCREFTTAAEPATADDFAYCVLMEEPEVQPIPIMMHCEADAYLPSGTDLVALGFGQSVASGQTTQTQGIKRWAGGNTTNALSSQSTHFHASQWSPGSPSSGDSGGPAFVEMPDGTWRQVGVAVNTLVSYSTVWPKVGWMLQDPNVDEAAIVPCHNVAGQWCPKPSCGDFPRSPETGAGDWARGPTSCESTDLGGGAPTCAGACIQPANDGTLAQSETHEEPVETGGGGTSDGDAHSDLPHQSHDASCSVAPRRAPPAMALLSGLLALCAAGPRRRR